MSKNIHLLPALPPWEKKRVVELGSERTLPRDDYTLCPVTNSCELPLADSSQDLFLSFNMHLLRMDQIYMVCAEARRVLPSGALWSVSTRTYNRFLPIPFIRHLDMNHYVSPEDWKIQSEKFISTWGINWQVLTLERL